MDFQLTDEQELLIESAREYASRYFTDEAVKQAYEVDHQGRQSLRGRILHKAKRFPLHSRGDPTYLNCP